jgi:hypothetical protein
VRDAAVGVHVVGTILRVVFDYEDQSAVGVRDAGDDFGYATDGVVGCQRTAGPVMASWKTTTIKDDGGQSGRTGEGLRGWRLG